MSWSIEWVIAIAIGIGLAAATGFRVFLPLLIAGLAAHWGALPLADGFRWLATPEALLALATASLVETVAYYIPGVDHLLDVLAGPAALAAGVVASASVMVDMPPGLVWPVAIVGGGGIAAVTKVTSAVLRAKTGIATLGLANPIVSTGETVGAITIALAAIVVPVVCLIVLLAMFVWVRRRRRRRAIA
jgi:hypothetical protein